MTGNVKFSVSQEDAERGWYSTRARRRRPACSPWTPLLASYLRLFIQYGTSSAALLEDEDEDAAAAKTLRLFFYELGILKGGTQIELSIRPSPDVPGNELTQHHAPTTPALILSLMFASGGIGGSFFFPS
jgi:hypothetical protein